MANTPTNGGGAAPVVVQPQIIDKAFEIALRTGQPIEMPDGIKYAVVPKDCQVVSLEDYQYTDYRPVPHRKKAQVVVTDPASFLTYWNLFHDKDSLVFADESNRTIKGVIDYHHAGSDTPARWGQHTVTLQLQQSDEWETWIGLNGKMIPQAEFGEFLEDNAVDILKPDAAFMLEVARDLKAKNDVTFESKVNVSSSSMQFTFHEDIRATAGAGKLDVPPEFVVRIPAFLGMDPVDVRARLRFRINNGKLSFSYHLLYPSRKQRDAFRKVRRQISDGIGRETINQ